MAAASNCEVSSEEKVVSHQALVIFWIYRDKQPEERASELLQVEHNVYTNTTPCTYISRNT